MKTELKLTLNNLKSNIKRTLFTIISIMNYIYNVMFNINIYYNNSS